MSTASLAWSQFRFERRLFWRNPSAALFNFMLPLVFLFLIATAYGADADDLDVLEPGIAAMAVMSTTFIALAYNMVFLREQGVLKRVRGTPMPPVAYFSGVIGNAVINAIVQVALVILASHYIYAGNLPVDWLTLILFVGLGVATFAALGIAFAQLIPNFDSAPAYTNAVFLPMLFISGVFYESDSLPAVLDVIAQILPLRHVVDGLEAALVTGEPLSDTIGSLAHLGAWFLVAIVVIARKFRWES